MSKMNEKEKLKKPPLYRFAAFILMLFPYIFLYAGIQVIASFAVEIMEDLTIKEASLSFLSSLGTLSMAVTSAATGGLGNRYGGKRTVILGLVIMAVSGALYLGNAGSIFGLYIIRSIQGAGTGVVCACLMALVSAWFPKKERGTAQGALGSFYGASISLVTIYALSCRKRGLAWNGAIGQMLLCGGIFLAVLIAFFYKDIEKTYGVSVIDEVIATDVGKSDTSDLMVHKGNTFDKPCNWKESLTFPGFWLIGLLLFFNGACTYGIGFIIPLFFTYCGFNSDSAASIMSVGTLSSIFFALFGGFISDHFFRSRRCEVGLISFGGAMTLFFIIVRIGGLLSAAGLTICYFLAYGMMYLSVGPLWCLPAEMVSSEFASRSMGAALLFSGIGGFVMTNLFGIIIQISGAGTGMYSLVGCMMIVFISFFLIRKVYRI